MHLIRNFWTVLWLIAQGLSVGEAYATNVTAPTGGASLPLVTNVAQFYRLATAGRHENYSVNLEGLVCWVDTAGGRFILRDSSGSMAVATHFKDEIIHPGRRIRLEGECSAKRTGLGFVAISALTVDNDGLHDPRQRSGSVNLEAGLNPIRAQWFNSKGLGHFQIFYEGPGLPCQPVPDSILYRQAAPFTNRTPDLMPGLDYQCWEGEWDFVPDFDRCPLAAFGAVANFDIGAATRAENVALEFSGYLKVPQAGRYTFHVESDDGSLLYVGESSLRIKSLGDASVPKPHRLAIGKLISNADRYQYCEVEGEVISVFEDYQAIRMELSSGSDRLLLEVGNAAGCYPELLLGGWLRATGICHGTYALDGRQIAGALWCPSWQEIKLLRVASERWALQPLARVSELLATNASMPDSSVVRVCGKVDSLGNDQSLQLRDPDAVITVSCSSMPTVRAGQHVEVVARINSVGTNRTLIDAQVQEIAEVAGNGKLPVLTSVRQVRTLTPEAASANYPVQVRGVVTATFVNGLSLVIQDDDQGVYVSIPMNRTRGKFAIGDACEVQGVSRRAAFAPMIEARQVTRLGLASLPIPLRPTWDQIVNGSLDSQYVEIQAIITGISESAVGLLTRVGAIELDLGDSRRIEWKRFENALVRIRGCVLAVYDRETHQVMSGKLRMIEPIITVDEPAPSDPFAFPVKRLDSLRSFDPQASAFQRVKVVGQMIYANHGLYCLMEGTNGLRFFPKDPTPLPPGMLVEVVGVLDLGGTSPVLREALVKQLRAAALPEVQALSETNLFSGKYDGTLVQVESLLMNVSRNLEDQVLELRTGSHLHTARLHKDLGMVPPISTGSRLEIKGVYLGKGGNWAAGQDVEDFDLVLSSPADITVLEKPSWWTPRRLLGLVGGLAGVLLLALGWIRSLRSQVEERTRQLAQQIQARQRIEQQRAIEQERTRLAQDLHDDLGGGLTEISMLGSLAGDLILSPDRKAGYLQQMTAKARHLVATLDEIVWAVNPRYDSLASLADYYSLYAQRFLGLASLACHLQVAQTLPDYPLDSKMRHSLFLALKEALNNVVRHAEASEVWLLIAMEENELIVAVTDNGRGLQLPAATASGRDGLANMRARLSALGGRCEIRSAPTAGTTVRFGVRLRKDAND